MISALVVNYNGERYLERCLASVPAALESGEEVELIVADSASTDGSATLVAERFPEARWLALDENLGFGAAVNRGVAAARGDRLLLLNNDAWLTAGCLDRLAARLAAEPGPGERELAWVVPRLQFPDGRRQFCWEPEVGIFGEAVRRLRNPFERRAWAHRPFMSAWRRLIGPGWLTAACALVRRDAFEQVGGFDEGFFLYFEDSDLCRRLRRAGWRLDWEPDALAIHASGGAGSEATRQLYRTSQRRYYRLHRPRWERWLLEKYLAVKS